MSSIPEWPLGDGPRVLTLVGNDITIDVRARKTASSLARSGFSVIALGVDTSGRNLEPETLDGARLIRLTPSLDSRISTRAIRLSRPELRDSLRFRLDMRRQRLQARRRTFTATATWDKQHAARWMSVIADGAARLAKLFRMPEDRSEAVRARVERTLRKLRNDLRHSPKKARLVADQRVTQAMMIAYKALARPPSTARRSGAWRRDLPELHRYEAAIGSIVDALQPDLIHCHDVFHLGLAARAKARAEADGREIITVYDAHEYIPGLPGDPVRRAAFTNLEDEYFDRADGVVTVAPEMADAIEARHGRRPEIVMNVPDMETLLEVEPVRSVAGVANDAKLVIYVGGIAPHRGAELMLDAMSLLPDVHLVLIVGPVTNYVAGLMDSASERDMGERIHTAPFVAPEAVVSYMASADASLIPLSRDVPNYEVTLPNKLFQSVHAGVPLAVSDNPAMASFVNEHGVGQVFEGGNAESMASTLGKVLEHREDYTDALHDPALLSSLTWRSQAENLIKLYGDLGVSL